MLLFEEQHLRHPFGNTRHVVAIFIGALFMPEIAQVIAAANTRCSMTALAKIRERTRTA